MDEKLEVTNFHLLGISILDQPRVFGADLS